MNADNPTQRHGAVRLIGRTSTFLLAAGLIALLAFGLTARATDTTIDDALAQDQAAAAPGFTLDILTRGTPPPELAATFARAADDDDRIDLRELRGTPVVLNYGASWCIPCREEAPLLQRAWTQNATDGVLFLGLNMQDARSDARNFLRAFKQTFPHVRDPTNDTARRWGASGIPETFFIRRDGAIVGHVIGVVTAQQLQRGIADAKAGRVQDPARGGQFRPTR